MKIKDISSISESVNDDDSYRHHARGIVDTLKVNIVSKGLEHFKPITYNGSHGYMIDGDDIGIDLQVRFIFVNADGGEVQMGFSPPHSIIIFYDIDGLSITDNTTIWTKVIHEVIHLIDFNRTSGKQKSSSDSYHDNGYASYVNSDAELNAHYQEMIAKTEERIDSFKNHANYHKVYDSLLSSVEKFVKFTLGTLDAYVKDSLSDKNLRKYKKRIASHYEKHKEELLP